MKKTRDRDKTSKSSYSGKLIKMIERENAFWSEVFSKELRKSSTEDYSSYWWKDYYKKITTYFNKLLSSCHDPKILEAGCGSGKATILLNRDYHKYLLDISKSALNYAKFLSKKFKSNNVHFIEGNIFSIKSKNDSYDLVWSIGVIEHYSKKKIIDILVEMIRVAKKKGIVAVGVPNSKSGPILKAKVLSSPLLKFTPGYRLNSEKFYSENSIVNCIKNALVKTGETSDSISIKYFGNPTIPTLKLIHTFYPNFQISPNPYLIKNRCKPIPPIRSSDGKTLTTLSFPIQFSTGI